MERRRFALITGCGKGGIGKALVMELLAHGFVVIATLLPNESREHLEGHDSCYIQHVDVTLDESVLRLRDAVDTITKGYLDVLGNNAGIREIHHGQLILELNLTLPAYQYPAVDCDMQVVEKVFAVNVLGPMRLVHHFHRYLIKAQGTIFNTGSTGGIFPTVYLSAYGASKAALHQYGDILRLELEPLGVRVINNITGEISTNILKIDLNRRIDSNSVYSSMGSKFEEFLRRDDPRMSPEQYARGVIGNILSKRPAIEYWRGTWCSAVRFIHRFLPRSVFYLISRHMAHLQELSPNKESLKDHMAAKIIGNATKPKGD